MRFWATHPQRVPAECFFCLSTTSLPHFEQHEVSAPGVPGGPPGSRWDWTCKRCGCLNLRDTAGRMLSDIPAMHDAVLNGRSRATPSNSYLPTASATSVASLFCRQCTTNQSMITNLLANYLPADEDPSYAALSLDLPHYVASLHHRYPPVCFACQPAVNEALRKADLKAEGEAWSYALKRGSAKVEAAGRAELPAVVVWRLRGALFCLGVVLSILISSMAWIEPARLVNLARLYPILWVYNTMSVGWIVWDPYWLRMTRYNAKVSGRGIWIRDMWLVLAARIAGLLGLGRGSLAMVRVSSAFEFGFLVHALHSLKVHQPVALSLVRPVKVAPAPAAIETPQLSYLSLDNDPFPKATNNPIFGRPSLQRQNLDDQPEPMDWEPIPISTPRRPKVLDSDEDSGSEFCEARQTDWNSFGAGKQRMFPKPSASDQTGLESLFASWGTERPPPTSEPETKDLLLDKSVLQKLVLGFAITRLTGATIITSSPALQAAVFAFDPLITNVEGGLNVAALVIASRTDDRRRTIGLAVMVICRITGIFLSRSESFTWAVDIGMIRAGVWAALGIANLACAQ